MLVGRGPDRGGLGLRDGLQLAQLALVLVPGPGQVGGQVGVPLVGFALGAEQDLLGLGPERGGGQLRLGALLLGFGPGLGQHRLGGLLGGGGDQHRLVGGVADQRLRLVVRLGQAGAGSGCLLVLLGQASSAVRRPARIGCARVTGYRHGARGTG